ncbi:CAP domain-containing protein [Streptomyces sp. HNM0645]|uniref:CAP domain-containing protein n=1 Tax=Streptomyces sp. HNM0645 TaxID=2782343 RepID=UPI0024B7F8D7|nr:CAP domain-containing protein [Streptomyces sp. HNM0645]MDI9888732.1 CAP domain-containing protein [Streptomyces sp. HNM0645]
MRKHRRTTHYRKITIAAVALGAVAVPSVAMACMDQPDGQNRPESRDSRSWGNWKNASSGNPWQQGGWDWKKKYGGEPGGAEQPGSEPGAAEPGGSAPAEPAPQAPAPAKPAAPKPTASPSAPASSAPASGAVARVVQLVNSERSKAGCSPVTVNAKLTKAAQDHSQDMASHRNMSHTGSDGSDPGTRISRAGYNWSTYGENVAYGYETPEKVMAGWMSSPGHKKNILNCEFKEIGVGLAQPGNYWTQDFGTAR